jgi:hypothetical protein
MTGAEHESLVDRIITIADETTGPHPVMGADEALGLIERELFELRVAAETLRQHEIRQLRRAQDAALWQSWGALVAMAAMAKRYKAAHGDWRDGQIAFVISARRHESQLMWQMWQGLVAMAMVQREEQRDRNRDLQEAYERGLDVDWRGWREYETELRRLEALRTWQAWSGVLVMVACVEHERGLYW